jgi:hypothetical protein
MKNKQTMRKLLQTIFLSFILILAISVSATANNGGDDGVKTHQTNNDIRVYPNPAIDYIMVTENDNVDKVWIYNILGKRVKAYKVETADAKYDIRDLPRGMYIVRLINHNGDLVMTRRVNKINP